MKISLGPSLPARADVGRGFAWAAAAPGVDVEAAAAGVAGENVEL